MENLLRHFVAIECQSFLIDTSLDETVTAAFGQLNRKTEKRKI